MVSFLGPDVLLRLKVEVTPFMEAMERLTRSLQEINWGRLNRAISAWQKRPPTPGDRHIDRIVKDCMTRRLPTDVTARRIMVASDIAGVLDNTTTQGESR